MDKIDQENIIYVRDFHKEGFTNEKIAEKVYEIYSESGVFYDMDAAEAAAEALIEPDGLNLSPAETAKALKDGANLETTHIAQALKSDMGGDLKYSEVAQALHSDEGCNLSAKKTVEVLTDREGLNCSPESVGTSLYAMRSQGVSMEEAAQSMHLGATMDIEKTAQTLFYHYESPPHLEEVVHDINEIMEEEFNYGLVGPASKLVDVAKALYSEEGLYLTPEQTAISLRYGADADVADVFKALHSEKGLGMEVEDVYNTMQNMDWNKRDEIIVEEYLDHLGIAVEQNKL